MLWRAERKIQPEIEGPKVGGRLGGLEVAIVAAVYLVLPPIVGAVMESLGVEPQSATGLPLLVLAGFLSAVLGVALAVALSTGPLPLPSASSAPRNGG